MNSNIFENAFSDIDDDFLVEAKSPEIRIAARRKKIVISAIAACVAAVLVAIPSIKVISDLNDNKFTASDDTEIIIEEVIESLGQSQSKPQNSEPQSNDSKPDISNSSGISSAPESIVINSADADYDDIAITVNDLYFTNIATNSPTTTYEKKYTPDIKYLYINPIPTDKYVTIYERYYQRNFDKNEVKVLADKYLPKMAQTLSISPPSYEIKERFNGLHNHIEIDVTRPFSLSQYDNRNIISYSPLGSSTLNGKTVTVNQTQSDQEIINSLSEIKQILFDTFDTSFDSAKVYRNYDDDSNYGVTSLNVYFYNSDAHPLNNLWGIGVPESDCITISFDNFENFEGDIVSNADLYNVFSIDFWSYRTDNHSPLKTVTQKELLPLQKAEEYLQKGYVLAMGGCAQCQAEQTPVDFTNYDYASFEYAGGSEIGDLMLPYYAFYKNIGTAENGNMIFAKTYVPAIEVEGYEEYFINKHNNHNTSNDSDNDYILEDNGE